MGITVKEIELWRTEVQNEPGALAETLAPLANARADLQVIMAYRYPGNETKAAIEVFPVKSRKSTGAAETAGMKPSSIPTLLIQGDNKPGLGHAFAQALASEGINIGFLLAQVLKGSYSAIIGFQTADDAKRAAPVIRKAAAARTT